jgi:hypothetical protein
MKPLFSLFIILTFLFFSCQNNYAEPDAQSAVSDTVSITGLTGDDVKLVKTAKIQLKVKDVTQSTHAVSALAQNLGGMTFDQTLSSIEEDRKELKVSSDSLLVITTYTPQADITARVPSEHLETFLYNASDLGYFTRNSNLHIDDKSLSYLENRLKEKNRISALSQTPPKGASSAIKTIAIRDEAIGQQIANRTIDTDVKYSTVTLSLFQNPVVQKEVIANYVIADYQLPFGQRLGNAFNDGWQYFLAFAVALAHLWMFILMSVGLFVSYKYWLRRKLARV